MSAKCVFCEGRGEIEVCPFCNGNGLENTQELADICQMQLVGEVSLIKSEGEIVISCNDFKIGDWLSERFNLTIGSRKHSLGNATITFSFDDKGTQDRK